MTSDSSGSNKRHFPNAILYAIFSAVLFGLSTPFAKMLTGRIAPVLLAGLLYFGSGLGLAIWLGLRTLMRNNLRNKEASLSRRDLPSLIAAVLSGGILAPIFLIIGLTSTSSSTASLLLNLESVSTFLIAWIVFKEGIDKRILIGAIAIVAGGILLSGSLQLSFSWGPIWIALACLAWGADNNLTRRISSGDPVQIGAIKGLAAGIVNIALGLFVSQTLPGFGTLLSAGVVGFLGYGLSLVFFILALRHLGAARTSAYFAMAPFVGAIASFLLLGEMLTFQYAAAAALIALGIYLHISEQHAHEHIHHDLSHEHKHFHDQHHRHPHDEEIDAEEPHAHFHQHPSIIHSHPHYPDIHHRHIH